MHCNFLINRGGATAADIEGLGEEVRRRVRETSGIELQWEIRRIGCGTAGSAVEKRQFLDTLMRPRSRCSADATGRRPIRRAFHRFRLQADLHSPGAHDVQARRRPAGRHLLRARGLAELRHGLRRGPRGRGLSRHARRCRRRHRDRADRAQARRGVQRAARPGRARTARSRACWRSCRIPYTHSGVLASALAMHKERAKVVMRAAGVDRAGRPDR